MTKGQWNKLNIGDTVFSLSHDREFNKISIKGKVLRFAFGRNQAEIEFASDYYPPHKTWKGRLTLEIEEIKVFL